MIGTGLEHRSPFDSVGRRSAFRRLAWAAAISIVLHGWFAALMTWRSDSRGGADGVANGPLHARLVDRDDLVTLEPAEPIPGGEGSAAAPAQNQPQVDGRRGSSSGGEAKGAAGIPDPTFYPARQLDVYPRLVSPLQVQYPHAAVQTQVSGHALVLLLIDELGVVQEASVVQAEPKGYFEEAAIAAFAGARFVPARKDSRIVRSRVLVDLKFSPDGPTVVP